MDRTSVAVTTLLEGPHPTLNEWTIKLLATDDREERETEKIVAKWVTLDKRMAWGKGRPLKGKGFSSFNRRTASNKNKNVPAQTQVKQVNRGNGGTSGGRQTFQKRAT